MQEFDIKRNPHPVHESGQTQATGSQLWESVCSLSNLLKAEKRCHRRVGYKNSVAKFNLLALTKCLEIKHELENGTYRTQLGAMFKVTYPKYREVRSTKYRDRIPQTSFVLNVYYPAIIPQLDPSNCACIKNRGVDFARRSFLEALRTCSTSDYCLKADIKSFFASIDHESLFALMRKNFLKDERCFWLYKDVINCNGKPVGIDLGSEVDQLSATTFLHPVDILFCGWKYVRYADDIVVLGTKEECILARDMLQQALKELRLTLSVKKTYIQPVSRPISFLGFTYLLHPTGRITLKRKRDRLKSEIRRLRKMHQKNVPIDRVLAHLNSVRDLMTRGSRADLHRFDNLLKSLWGDKIMPIITHHDLDQEANIKRNASGVSLYGETDEKNDKIVRLIRERYSLSMELALHRKKMVGVVDEDEWDAYQAFVIECIEKVKDEPTENAQ